MGRLTLLGWLGFLLMTGAACTALPGAVAPDGPAEPPGGTGITGMVTDHNGVPAAGAYVYAYRNARSGLRGPADFEAAVGADGHYLLDLVAGNYHLVARQRPDGGDTGPPRTGDAWALPATNPVKVITGQLASIDFVLHTVTQPMLMREGTLTGGDTGLTGVLTDAAGRPLSGAFVLGYPDSDYRRMPEATSPAVGEDGRFTLYVERSGRWCLAARTRTRGQPVAGELYGILGEGIAGCRDVPSGTIIDVGPLRLIPYRR